MVEIGGHPILWHIMKTYSYWGFNEFVVLTGYKHTGFWRPMDTLKDKNDLTALWLQGTAPWALWSKHD
jgi:NDP-sugar pyrophosphorylase family protein